MALERIKSFLSSVRIIPDVLYGRDFEDEFLEIETIDGEIGEVTLRGQVLYLRKAGSFEADKFILTFDITDFTDTITAKMFIRPEIFDEVKNVIQKGMFLKIKGVTTIDKFDGELTLGSIGGNTKKGEVLYQQAYGLPALEKRVELHCHTKMSDMDGVSVGKRIW